MLGACEGKILICPTEKTISKCHGCELVPNTAISLGTNAKHLLQHVTQNQFCNLY